MGSCELAVEYLGVSLWVRKNDQHAFLERNKSKNASENSLTFNHGLVEVIHDALVNADELGGMSSLSFERIFVGTEPFHREAFSIVMTSFAYVAYFLLLTRQITKFFGEAVFELIIMVTQC